jgi:hypothetical protein
MKKNRWVSILLAFSMLAAFFIWPLNVRAVVPSSENTPPVEWQVSKGKTASPTELNQNKKITTVTLSLPSTEAIYKDIVFVVDKSEYANGNEIDKATKAFFNSLIVQQNQTPNLKISVGVVKFDGWGIDAIAKHTNGAYSDLVPLSADTMSIISDSLNDSAAKMGVGGTNTEQPVRMAQKMLESGHENAERFIILLSDFTSYVYEGSMTVNGVTYDCLPVASAAGFVSTPAGPLVSVWENWFKNLIKPKDFPDLYSQYTSGSLAATTDWGKDEIFFRSYTQNVWINYEQNPSKYDNAPTTKLTQAISADVYQQDAVSKRLLPNLQHIQGLQRSMILTYKALQNALQSGTQVIAYRIQDGNFGNNPLVTSMLSTLSKSSGTKVYDCYAGKVPIADVFTFLQNKITYLIGSGSVSDDIGSDFDLVWDGTSCPFELTLGGVRQEAVQTGDSEWSFGAKDANGAYPYVVIYTPGTSGKTENILWEIHVPVENANQLQLSYRLVLTASPSAAITKYPTNGPTTLTYSSSDGLIQNAQESFISPIVTYTKAPDHYNVGPAFNRVEHMAYIIGYEDANVHPEGLITRAETATIFFRLMTDESRSSFWKTTNSFSDVSNKLWFNNAVSTMANANFIVGYADGTFGGNKPITRAEFAAIAARAYGSDGKYAGKDQFTDISGHWAEGYINDAVELGLAAGYSNGTFQPNTYITRAEAMTIVNRFLDRDMVDLFSLIPGMITWPDNMNKSAWYYCAVQEATNSHDYIYRTDNFEAWTKINPVRDWAALEKTWATANSGK